MCVYGGGKFVELGIWEFVALQSSSKSLFSNAA